MPTTDQYARIYNKKILPLDTLKQGILDYLIGSQRAATKRLWNRSCLFVNLTNGGIVPTGNNHVNIAAVDDFIGTDGLGRIIQSLLSGPAGDRSHSDLQNVPIPPGTKTYDIATTQVEVDNGIETNPRTGDAEYTNYIELLGYLANPDSVTAAGTSIKMYVNTAFMMASADDHSGRSVRVWLKSTSDGGPGAVRGVLVENAFQIGTIAHDGGGNYVTIANGCGQTVPSTTASDYQVMLMGPLVTDHAVHPLLGGSGILFLGHVLSVSASTPIPTGNIDNIGQSVAPYGIADQAALVESYTHNFMRDSGKRSNILDANGSIISGMAGDSTPIPALQKVPGATAGTGLHVIYDAGSANAPIGGTGPGMSDFSEIAWAAATLLHAAADAMNTRYDIVAVNAAAMPGTLCTLSIITGTASGAPVLPTVPSNKIGLFAVTVPPGGGTTAYDFGFVRLLHRRIEGPFSSFHGILTGCTPVWSLVNSATDSVIKLPAGVEHIPLIDGERIEYFPNDQGITAEISSTLQPGTPAGTDVPFYIYLCGGRHCQLANAYATPYRANSAPLKVVACSVAPSRGRAVNDITDSGGNTIPRAATLYIGIGYRAAATLSYRSCIIEGDWVYSCNAQKFGGGVSIYGTSGFCHTADTVSGSPEVIPMVGAPAPSTMMELDAHYIPCDTNPRLVPVFACNVASQYDSANYIVGTFARDGAIGMSTQTRINMHFRKRTFIPANFTFSQLNAVSGDIIFMSAEGFNMNVKRLSI